MDTSDPALGYCWTELSADEVLSLLHDFAAANPNTCATGFLDTHQWSPLSAIEGATITGGHPAAQYRRVGLAPCQPGLQYFTADRGELPEHVRNARQLRSWLYSSGVPDGAVGDILVSDSVSCFAAPNAEIDRLLPALRVAEFVALPAPPTSRTTAASRRADALLTALFKVSRGEAQVAIEYGFVFRNFQPLGKRTQALTAGDQIVYRTKGRAEIVSLETNPRSGRVWVEFVSFPA